MRGYWEDQALAQFTKDLTDDLGLMSDRPPPEDVQVERAASGVWRERAQQLLRDMQMSAPGGVWLWKYPPGWRLLPFWQRIWDPEQIIYVIAIRHPISSALSQRAYLADKQGAKMGAIEEFPLRSVLLAWQRAMSDILRHTAQARAVTTVEYEALLQQPREQCQRLAAFLAQHTGLQGDLEAMVAAVQPDLQHYPAPDDAALSVQQRALYALLQRRARDLLPAIVSEEILALPPGWEDELARLAAWGRATRSK